LVFTFLVFLFTLSEYYHLTSHRCIFFQQPIFLRGDVNNNDRLLLGAVLLVGRCYLFKNECNASTTLNDSSGINFYKQGEFELNVLEFNNNYVSIKNLETDKVQVDLLSFKYQFK